jgi:hypothetical protein
VSKSSFTLSTAAGQKVTVKKVSSTKYKKAAGPTSAGAVRRARPSSHSERPTERSSRPARSS